MQPGRRDTSAAAAKAQTEALRRLSPSERAALASSMSDSARTLTELGIRQRHPEYSPEEVRTALLETMLGKALASKVSRWARSHPRPEKSMAE